MHSLNKIQIISDWTGERSARATDRLLPVLYPDTNPCNSKVHNSAKCNSTKSILQEQYKLYEESDFSYKIFKSSYDSEWYHHYYDEKVYYYKLPSGSLMDHRYRGESLRHKPWDETLYFTEKQKRGLYVCLTRDIGLGSRLTRILLDRRVSQYRRIEEFISGFVDSLWLADELVFLEHSPDRACVKKVLRKIFAVGTFNLCALVDQWKEFGNYCFHTLAQTKLIGGELSLSKTNIFKHLLNLRFIKRVMWGYKSHRDMQNIAHLMSSRQMPYMGLKAELKARAQFKRVMESDYRPPKHLVDKMYKVAHRIGRICKKLAPGPINDGVLHFSVTSSGELNHSLKQGAQAKAVMEAFKKHLSVVPDSDFIEETPFGDVIHKSGIPLWKTAYRPEVLYTEREFLEEYELIKGQPNRVMGLDEYAGIQMLYAAWKDKENIPEVRTEVVPEMGNKPRHVTVSAYWLNLLQAPLAHYLIEAMKWHPACFSSFHREDQGWEAARQLARIKRPLSKDEFVLSSDLKDATNAQQWDLTKSMLRGFMAGYGIDIVSPYVNMVVESIGPRLIWTKDEESILSNVGIMMGEAIAKPSLTLLNLCIEELAFLRYCKREYYLDRDKPSPARPWRCYHIGGDDHLARGPLPYLQMITNLHLECGSHIDPGKHGYSRICVRYTERVLDLTNLGKNSREFDKADPTKSIIVDSVKVRLLEKGLSTGLKKDNKNVAIGKAKQLGGVISWLPDDPRLFPIGKIESIRELFIKRMGNLLPNENNNPRAFANIHLPQVLGGYGLGRPSETKVWLALSPEPTRYILAKKLSFQKFGFHQDLSRDLRIFAKLNHNTSVRGLESMTEYLEARAEEEAQEPFRRSPQGFGFRKITYKGELLSYEPYANRPYATWEDIKTSFRESGDSARKIIDRAANNNWISQSEYINRCSRGVLFNTLLQGQEKLKPFNTVPWVKTYQRHIWPWYEKEGGPSWDLSELDYLTNDEIISLINDLRGMWYVHTSARSTVRILREDQDDNGRFLLEERLIGPRMEIETKGLPNLQISEDFLKIRIKQRSK